MTKMHRPTIMKICKSIGGGSYILAEYFTGERLWSLKVKEKVLKLSRDVKMKEKFGGKQNLLKRSSGESSWSIFRRLDMFRISHLPM